MSKDKYSDTTVIIPTLNEEGTIGDLIDLLIKLYPGINVIVSDDGSKDNTQKIVNSYNKKNKSICVLDRANENVHGLTASVVDAANIAKTDYIIVVDGDFQHPPEKIQEIRDNLDNFDLVVGTRIKGFLPKISLLHLYRFSMSRIATYLARLRLYANGIKCRDPMSGFFGVKTNVIKGFNKDYFELEGYKVLFDLMKRLPRKTKLGEVYFDFGTRQKGDSKINSKHVMVFFKSLFK